MLPGAVMRGTENTEGSRHIANWPRPESICRKERAADAAFAACSFAVCYADVFWAMARRLSAGSSAEEHQKGCCVIAFPARTG